MSWIFNIIPACCSKRTSPEKQDKATNTIPEIKVFPAREPSDESEVNDKIDDLALKPFQPNHSRRSTNYTACSFEVSTKNQTSTELVCGICGKPAEGYCPSCPFKRYCKVCYLNEHSNRINLHVFVSYRKEKVFKDFKPLKFKYLK
jgi:hypothetical protein